MEARFPAVSQKSHEKIPNPCLWRIFICYSSFLLSMKNCLLLGHSGTM